VNKWTYRPFFLGPAHILTIFFDDTELSGPSLGDVSGVDLDTDFKEGLAEFAIVEESASAPLTASDVPGSGTVGIVAALTIADLVSGWRLNPVLWVLIQLVLCCG
jgi:hypothetical protein